MFNRETSVRDVKRIANLDYLNDGNRKIRKCILRIYVGYIPIQNRNKKIKIPTYHTLSKGLDISKTIALISSSLVLCLMILKALAVELFQRNL